MLAVVALATGANVQLPWSVLGSGGGSSSSSNFELKSTSGQSSPIGVSGSINFDLEAGFWYGILPLPTKQAPGDSDGDGCTDEQENGDDARLGGQRNYLYFWDFFDTPDASNVRNQAINVVDVFAVALRFGQQDQGGAATINRKTDPLSDASGDSYHPAFDRGPLLGPNLW